MRQIIQALSILLLSFSTSALFAWNETNTDNSESCSPKSIGLTIDRRFSPFVGSELMFTGLYGYEQLDKAIFSGINDDTETKMIAARFLKFFFIDYTVSSLAMIVQHEVFGHGFRAREFHLSPHYKINPFEGETSFSAAKYNALSFSEKMAINIGGIEATGVMANELRKRFNENNRIDYHEGTLYLLSSLDQTLYVLDTKKQDKNGFQSSHDIQSYIRNLNNWHQKTVMTSGKLRRRILIDFLDPYLFYSGYSIGQYIASSQQQWEYPMITIGEYQYLPAMRNVLTPFGPEYQLSNFIKTPEHQIVATLRYGNTGSRHSFAMGLEASHLLTADLLSIGAKADIWEQPKLFTTTAATAKAHFGGALSLIGRYRVANPFELVGQLGYKTTGFMPGEILKHSPIVRLGFMMNI